MGFCAFIATALPFLHIHGQAQETSQKSFSNFCLMQLDLMARGLSAGHAFTEALHMVATEMPEPISTEFRKTYEEQNLGLSLKLALQNMVERVPLLDLRMCVTCRHDPERDRR
jgi:tight adherence protein B